MASQESIKEQLTDEEKPTQEVLEVPTTAGTQTRTRSPSPGQSQAVVNEFRVQTQRMRLRLLEQLNEQLRIQGLTSEQLKNHDRQAKTVWDSFNQDHELLGASCKSSFLLHPYMTEGVFEKAFGAYLKITGEVAEALLKLEGTAQGVDSERGAAHPNRSRANKPEIKLPTFSGELTSWPEFRDLFASLIIEDTDLSNVERLQYLKTSLQGEAARLVSGAPMTAEAFPKAWRRINDRYNDHDRLVQAYLDRLLSNQREVPRTGRALNGLLSEVKQDLDALAQLKEPVEQWSQIIIYAVARRLPASLREAWEINKKGATERLNYHDLLKLIHGRAQALESLPPPQSSSTKTQCSDRATVGPRSVHTAVVQTGSTRYPCDHCKGDHFIVMCPKFKDLHPSERHKIAVQNRLCFNCLGHHNLSACSSTRTCRTCGAKHHTMIHFPTQRTAQASSTQ